MIFLKKKTHNLEELDQYFEDSINLCQNLPIGSKFLLIAFDQSINGFHYTEKSKYDIKIFRSGVIKELLTLRKRLQVGYFNS